MSDPTKPPPLPTQLPVIAVATRGHRIVAALLDVTVVLLFSGMLLTRVLWPQYYPEVYGAFQEAYPSVEGWFEELETTARAAQESGEPVTFPLPTGVSQREAQEFFSYAVVITSFLVWLYFFVSELILKGSSLGKSVFGMRVMSLRTGMPPSAFEISLRGTVKAFCFLQPILILVNTAILLFNKDRRSGHDLVSRTIVVSGQMIVADPKPVDD
ncbi:MAG: RDD family protein [Verrucomicrobiota bacterium]